LKTYAYEGLIQEYAHYSEYVSVSRTTVWQ